MKTPFDTVTEQYKFYDTFGREMENRPYQINTINELAPLPAAGYYLDVGTGKTMSSTVSMLYKCLINGVEVCIITMPPILISGWKRFLERIVPKPSVLAYVGSPKERAAMKFKHQFILMSMTIFKLDYDSIIERIDGRKLLCAVDEATSVKNISSQNHKFVRALQTDHGADLLLLTGTPLSKPGDAYAYIKMIAPGTYRNLAQFNNIHVADVDFFGNVSKWKNLELLAENMKINAVRLLRREIRTDTLPVQYIPMYYDLDPKHYKLYKKLVEEELLELESGGKIDATQENAMYHATQQLVTNWGHFAEDPALVSAGYKLVEEALEELGDRKLIVYSNYRMTNRGLVNYFSKTLDGKVLAMFGDISAKKQNEAKELFAHDPSYRLMIAQYSSAGVGVDEWQYVCSDVIFLELPRVPKDFYQAVGRVDRDGQTETVNVRIGVANNTVQNKLMHQVLANDTLIGKVLPNIKDLRDALFGK